MMKRLTLLFFTVLIGASVTAVEGSRILVAAPFGTKSLQNIFVPLVKELARRGHHITVISNYAATYDGDDISNIHEIIIDQLALEMSAYPNIFEYLLSPWSLETIRKTIEMLSATSRITREVAPHATFDDPRVRDLVANDKFDLVFISEASPVLGYQFAWHFKAPMIASSPNVLIPGRATQLGDDEHYSYVPFLMSSYSDRMTLYQRTINVLFSKLFVTFFTWNYPEMWSKIEAKGLFNQLPSYEEIAKNVSLVFTNTHPSFSYPRALPPQVIEIGAMHCRPAKLLPKDLEAFVSSDSSEDEGFILFGVGSALKMDDMPEEMVQSFIKVFSRLPQRVIWQWKGTPRSDLPSNVLAIPWLPQQDLLGHKNCRAFMTHGGLNSLQEAIYHGVPVIGLPFMTDQHFNLKKAVGDGYAIKLDWKDVNEQSLSNSLQQILHNPTYEVAADKLSSLFRDQLQTPLETAVFWTEFVIRHNGTDHLQLGSRNLSPVQRNLVDVYSILFLSTIVPFIVLYFCFKKCCCCRRQFAFKEKHQ